MDFDRREAGINSIFLLVMGGFYAFSSVYFKGGGERVLHIRWEEEWIWRWRSDRMGCYRDSNTQYCSLLRTTLSQG